jgi:hypothetical protein
MKQVTKLYLRSFFMCGLTFGLLMTIWEYIDAEKISIWKQIIQGVIFGAFMSWFTVRSQIKTISKNGKEQLTEEDFKTTQFKSIDKKIAINEIYELLKCNELTKNWKIKIDNSKIVGRTKITWLAWGEKIKISVLSDAIIIESKPILRTTLLDNGKNRNNVLLIEKIIENK